MKTMAKNKLYEGMFLVDSAQTGADWDGVIAAIRTILERAGAEIVSIRKWDDRRLAYEIKGKARGTYILCYFNADGQKIKDIEKAAQLSEKIMRVLILSADQISADDIEKDTPATKVEKEREKRKTAKEAEPSRDQQEAQPADVTEITEEAEAVEETKQAEEVESEGLQDSEPKTIFDY